MITRDEIDALAAFDGAGNPVLSVYLKLDQERQVQRSLRLVFDGLVAELEAELDELARLGLTMEADRVRAHLSGDPPPAKGVAIFSCTSPELWQVVELPVPVDDLVQLDTRPQVLPLHDVVDEFERYAVALVDQQQARLYTIYLGTIEEQASLASKVLSRQANGGWSQARYQRRRDLQVSQHIGSVVDELLELHEAHPFDRLVLAGIELATRELREALPPVLAEAYAGSLTADLTINDAELLARTLEAAAVDERSDEAELVESMLGTAAAQGTAAAGLKAVLEAVWHAQVHQLVVAEGLAVPGAACPQCLWLEPIDEARLPDERSIGGPATVAGRHGRPKVVRCRICQGELERVPDVVERAVQDTVTKGGSVEVVHGEAATRLHEPGGICASLRYA